MPTCKHSTLTLWWAKYCTVPHLAGNNETDIVQCWCAGAIIQVNTQYIPSELRLPGALPPTVNVYPCRLSISCCLVSVLKVKGWLMTVWHRARALMSSGRFTERDHEMQKHGAGWARDPCFSGHVSSFPFLFVPHHFSIMLWPHWQHRTNHYFAQKI